MPDLNADIVAWVGAHPFHVALICLVCVSLILSVFLVDRK